MHNKNLATADHVSALFDEIEYLRTLIKPQDTGHIHTAISVLKDVLQTIHDCQDMFISDVGKLERIQSELSNIFKIVRGENYYSDWVLAEEDDD